MGQAPAGNRTWNYQSATHFYSKDGGARWAWTGAGVVASCDPMSPKGQQCPGAEAPDDCPDDLGVYSGSTTYVDGVPNYAHPGVHLYDYKSVRLQIRIHFRFDTRWRLTSLHDGDLLGEGCGGACPTKFAHDGYWHRAISLAPRAGALGSCGCPRNMRDELQTSMHQPGAKEKDAPASTHES